MNRSKAIGVVVLLAALGCVLLAALRGGADDGQPSAQTADVSPARQGKVPRPLFTMNQLFAEGQTKASAGSADKHDSSKTGSAMSPSGLDDAVAEMLESDPQLRKFYNLRRKAVRTSVEQLDYLAMISDAKMIADARRDLVEVPSATDVDQGDELKRLQRIQFLNSALAWEDNPERARALEAVTTAVLADLPVGASKLVKGTVLGDKFDLFQLLMMSDPEQAKAILAKARGSSSEKILQLAWQNGSE